ncbi:NlpC/P60 family protein [Streptomyces sp. NPDC093097]|uniref:C40 family peptidase n=1 Tax=Streptomyces sp. NPDC093097 TaxID=3366027 RepID=UPI00382D3CC0
MKRPLLAAGASLGGVAMALIGVLVLFVAAVANGAAGHQETQNASGNLPPGSQVGDIPPQMLTLYRQAAPAACRGLDWSVLAAVGKVETDHGRHPTMRSEAGAVGPMQFLPSTFTAYAHPVPPGGAAPPTPWDPADAVYAAARMLCANGAKTDTEDGLYRAIYSYNHADWYVRRVLGQAHAYAAAAPRPGEGEGGGGSGNAIMQAALGQLGVPYVWGGGTINGPSGGGFDCSGLTSYAVHQGTRHRVVLPRTSQEQRHAGTPVPRDQMQPGDLIIFDKEGWGHVGIYAGGFRMVDAPRPGKAVEVISLAGYWEQYTWSVRRVA